MGIKNNNISLKCESENIETLLKFGEKLIENKNFQELASWYLPMIAEVSTTIEDFKNFCIAGGISQFNRVIRLFSTNIHYRFGIISLLEEISFLLSIKYPTYDDHIGDIPFLIFFLSERHKFYVDIDWKYKDLFLMEEFIETHLDLICQSNYQEDVDKEIIELAISNLLISINFFPPHRVVSKMAACFSKERFGNFLQIFQQLLLHSKNHQLLCKLIMLITSILNFGLGYSFLREALQTNLRMHLTRVFNFGIRCSCDFCEFPRRLKKVASFRDEFGVPESQPFKKDITLNFIRAGGLKFMKFFINKIIKSDHTELEHYDSENNDRALQYFSWGLYLICTTEKIETTSFQEEFHLEIFGILELIINLTSHSLKQCQVNLLNNSNSFESGPTYLLLVIMSLLVNENVEENVKSSEPLVQKVNAILKALCYWALDNKKKIADSYPASFISIVASLHIVIQIFYSQKHETVNCSDPLKSLSADFCHAQQIRFKNDSESDEKFENINNFEASVQETSKTDLLIFDCCIFFYNNYLNNQSLFNMNQKKEYLLSHLQLMATISRYLSSNESSLNETENQINQIESNLNWIRNSSQELEKFYKNLDSNGQTCTIIKNLASLIAQNCELDKNKFLFLQK